MRPTVEALERIAHNFDFDPKVPGNGYRSLVQVVDACVDKLLKVVDSISRTRESLLFRSNFHIKELESYGKVLGQLRVILGYAQKLVAYSEAGNLFPSNNEQFPENVMLEIQALDRECFYGRCLGFQFCDSLWQPLQTVAVALASYAEGYQKYEGPFSRVASSFFHSGRYLTNPEARGKQILDITNKSDIRFCKAFWSITEGDVIAEMCNLMAGSVAVNKLIQIQPHNFEMERSDGEGETATITPPCAHTGPAPVQIRLLCFVEREGQGWLNEAEEMAFQQMGKNSKKTKQKIEKPPSPMSKGLLIHIHGGGFVAHTSKSHEIYLRSWAKDLGVPIVSIDYSLAPEQPFPRAFEECFFAYAWAVKNAPYLGSTGEHICLAGDSSGGNLCTAVAMRAASYGIQVPDGIVTMYTPFVVHHSPSPSRLLCLFDPLLPFGVLMRCLSAYVGLKEEFMSDEKVSSVVDTANDRILGSPKRSSIKSEEGSPVDGEIEKKLEEEEEEENGNSTKVTTPTSKEGINGDIIVPPPADTVSSFMEEVPPTDIEKLEQVSDAIDNATIGQGDGQTETNGDQSSTEAIAIFDPSHPPNSEDLSISLPVDVDAISLDSKPEADRESEDTVPLSPKSREDLHLDLKQEGLATDEEVQTPTSFVNSPIRVFRDAPIMRNPYVSPLFSDEELLKGLPPVHIIGCALDPLLDDSISFARKLRGMGKPVFLEIVDHLPHGFLNFSTVGKECKEASMVCVRHIMHVLYGFHDDEFETLAE
ncbi:hormone-sensitive lipase-like isoform X2 [Lytechinus variegatus]|uniref:hormone-sensitive lipase-like isoform X2 n=1 Tax=Lytechinus variegatus TaxID=7654 RepID=UPI001BB1CC66|nr:hormone-sensitive lipase-like isoform X2 [Lytechinus variegatus]